LGEVSEISEAMVDDDGVEASDDTDSERTYNLFSFDDIDDDGEDHLMDFDYQEDSEN